MDVLEHSNHNVCVTVFRLPCVERIPKEAARRQHFWTERHTVSSDKGQIRTGGESK